MSARDDLAAYTITTRTVTADGLAPLLDAHHTEAFTEGARLLEDAACDADWDRSADYCAGLRAGAELLLATTTETGTASATPEPTAPTVRQRIFNYLTGRALCRIPRKADEAEGLLDAHRVENRLEAAAWFASYPFNAETTDWARGRGDNLAWVISILRNPDPRMPEAGEVQAEFFQVGHTYTEPDGTTDWKFRVDYITTHPEDGERTAIGWRHFRGEWDVYAYGEDDFEIHRLVGYIDATEAGDGS